MGREARCACRWPGGTGAVHALLETHELIVRGAARHVVPIAAMTGVRVDGGALCVRAPGVDLTLELGADVAARWAKKIATPPPTLAEKLGVSAGAKAWVIGTVSDDALRLALHGATADSAAEAALSVAVVADAKALGRALDGHATLATRSAIWVVYGKGSRTGFGEGAVRSFMRQAGFVDVKISAVSPSLSATRFIAKK